MRYFVLIYILSHLLIITSFAQKIKSDDMGAHTRLGNESLVSDYLAEIENKSIGLITNHTGVFPNGTHLVDSLNSLPKIEIAKIFAPEHGLRGNAPAGEEIVDGIDKATGIRVISLYGKSKKPTAKMLRKIDLLLYDIQDVGARFYTYISTLYYCMEAASENDIPLYVLDRPNPINGNTIEGPILESKYQSFVGIAPLPIRYGLTIGELALYFNDLILQQSGKKCNLKVIKLKNWNRDEFLDQAGLLWHPTSPNIPNLETALVYPGMCLLEATNVSEGRGTNAPFLTFGAPWINSEELLTALNRLKINGVKFTSFQFTPINISGKAFNPKYKNEKCNGIQIKVTDKSALKSVGLGIAVIYSILKLYPNKFRLKSNNMARLYGNSQLEKLLLSGADYSTIIESFTKDEKKFKYLSSKYLLY